ncbi:MAG: hypothetical protein KF768_02265 [Phycisphaeraceae bacterium]|nr:hypothetical protein [Phycisphaeraceae bacterium]
MSQPSMSGGGAFKPGAMLGVADERQLSHERAVELAAMFNEVVGNFDQLVWGTWKAVAPNSPIKRQQNLRQVVAKYAAGDPGVTREQVKAELDRLRALGAALIASLNQAGRQYAQKHANNLSPSQIEAGVRLGGKSVMVGHEVQCWRKYAELAQGLDADTIERDLHASMAAHAESLFRTAAASA